MKLVETKQEKKDVRALHHLCFPFENEESFRRLLENEKYFTFHIDAEAYVTTHVKEVCATTLYLGTNPKSRGQGYATRLFLSAMHEARSRGAEYLDSFSSEDNEDFKSVSYIHRMIGFIPLGSFPDHYMHETKKCPITVCHFRASLMNLGKRPLEPGRREEVKAPGVGVK